jgi:serine/threonine-protein kinase
VVAIVRQIADAVAAAHAAGIVHRDLKPENIFLTTDDVAPGKDEVKLFDFGVAKLVGDKHEASHKTAAGSIIGTPYYMAPEQVLGHDIDARTDVYALGAVLYETVTGVVPFPETRLIDILAAVIKQVPAPPNQHRPELPLGLARLIMRCLEKDPAARPESMAVFAAELSAQAVAAPDSGLATGATLMAGAAELGLTRAALAAAHAAPMVTPPPAMLTRTLARGAPGAIGSTTLSGAARSGSARVQSASGAGGLVSAFARQPPALKGLAVAGVVIALAGASWGLLAGGDPPKPVATVPGEAAVTIDSTPRGARVVRLADSKIMGTTPVRDFMPGDGRRQEYLLRLEGYVEAHQTFLATSAGEHSLMVTLMAQSAPVAVPRPPPTAHSGSSRSHGKKVGRTAKTAAAPAFVPVADVPSRPRPAAAAGANFEQMPTLLPATRVRRLGH